MSKNLAARATGRRFVIEERDVRVHPVGGASGARLHPARAVEAMYPRARRCWDSIPASRRPAGGVELGAGDRGGLPLVEQPRAEDEGGATTVAQGGLDEFDGAPGADHPDVDVDHVHRQRAEDVVRQARDAQPVPWAPGVAVAFHLVGE
ncbi:hypothetical protein MTP03_25400 [Tsukamurella sp. PLM1]|nr:hypothetical protein MTP03_25400 [Tsukamurella sp. PLM1]